MKHHKPTTLADMVSVIGDLCNEAGVDCGVRRGPEAMYPDSLYITINILKHLFGFTSEAAFLRYVGKHHHDLFPDIPERSWFNRKTRSLEHECRAVHHLILQ